MPRQKPDAPLLTEPQIDELLGEFRQLQDECDSRTARLDAKITQLKEIVRVTLAPLKKRLKAIRDQVHVYIWQHRADFDKPRSKALTHGVIGVRKIREDKFDVSDEESAIVSIRLAQLPDHLIVTREKIDLKALAAHLKDHPGDLAKIAGISRPDDDEEPWFETSSSS
jgi:phage host-nuclease inhibitor protein Gam